MKITNDIKYIGVNDRKIDLFEGQYDVPNGMAYNSYVILDEKCAVMDTVDRNWGDEWLANLKAALDGRAPNYLVVHHMEPDHSANIARFLAEYPEAVVVSSDKAFVMLDSCASNEVIISTISHETDHLLGTLNHGGEGLAAYAYDKVYYISVDKDNKLFYNRIKH